MSSNTSISNTEKPADVVTVIYKDKWEHTGEIVGHIVQLHGFPITEYGSAANPTENEYHFAYYLLKPVKDPYSSKKGGTTDSIRLHHLTQVKLKKD